MVINISFRTLGDGIARRMGVRKEKGKKGGEGRRKRRESAKMGTRYGQPGIVLTCYLELVLYKKAIAPKGKGC